MKPSRLIRGAVLFVGIALFTAPSSSQAALSASEPFDFTGTALVGNGSGTGWGANLWTGGTVAMPNDATSLAYPAGSAFTVSGQRIKPTASATAIRILASSFNLASGNGPYYLSFLAKKDATGAFRIEANNATPAPRWGVRVNADGSVAVQGGGTAYGAASAAGVFANGTTYLVVLKYVGSGSARHLP